MNVRVQRLVIARIPIDQVEFQLHLYRSEKNGKDHLALTLGEVAGKSHVLTRVHSECFTGDVLGSLRCDCGEQLAAALRKIAWVGCGILIYLRQEGRGIGLLDKLRAYNLQDEGYDTVDANLKLGHRADERDYNVAAQILKDLNVRSIQLLTNNPRKIILLRESGILITQRVPLEPTVNKENAGYLFTKATRMNHLLNLEFVPVIDDHDRSSSHQ